MGRKKHKRKRALRPGIFISAAFCIMAFSLLVRWSGIGRNLSYEDRPFRIEVLNGTGENGLAMQTAMELRKMGIDVLIIGDAERYDFQESVLIDRKGAPQLMKRLSRLVGCRRVIEQIQERPLVDATLIVGKDKDKLKITPGS